MKTTLTILTLPVIMLLMFTRTVAAITADELAGLLSVSFWETSIDAPADSLQVELIEIKDGKVGSTLLNGHNQSSSQKEKTRLVVFIQPTQTGIRGTITMNGSTVCMPDYSLAKNRTSFSRPLPEVAGCGEYLLWGTNTPKDGVLTIPTAIDQIESGLLLRIQKKEG